MDGMVVVALLLVSECNLCGRACQVRRARRACATTT